MALTTASKAYAHLEVINYEKIKNKEPAEIQRLAHASKPKGGRGLFFLDLRGPIAGRTLADAQSLYQSAAKFFDASTDKKQRFYKDGFDDGFSAHGDVEVFEIARDELVNGSLKLPVDLQLVEDRIRDFLSIIDTISRDIYHVIGSSIDPPIHLTTTSDLPSDTGLQLAWARPEAHEGKVIAPAHTDRGLLTLLYYDVPTLEVPVDGTDEWRLVKPSEGSVVGYVGDALQRSSEGRLLAPVHRVVAPQGRTYVAAYLLRPAFGTESTTA
ncbi:hypothetical protein BKA61DRAFT_678408 [Leptodontidium sp. MPI-SDFR-AT-0119]|nr:hypothetical protein BKA61DRAFT_678408 [Leptodontidium sp. MPI-SDFR-AT-0119]